MRQAARSIRLSVFLLLVCGARAAAQPPVHYRVSFPAPEHHYAQVEVVFTSVPPGTLEARMSRSSPGRYALHEFAKNVFDVHAFDGKGKAIPFTRPNPDQWNVAAHDGTVRITYKVFGNRVDGTYLAVDSSHAHMNMPATLMWARGFDMRPVRMTFEPPVGSRWKPATQLFPTADRWTFTAPNLPYLMDSPAELSDHTVRSFKVRNPDGREFTIHTAIHHDVTDAAVSEYVTLTEKMVNEMAAVFGEFPQFDNGAYVFLGDYVPWGGSDGMEHRNSTVVAEPVSLRDSSIVRAVLRTASHEFFHAWNVERIRPRSLEPFDFDVANISGELWLGEGFTQYYGELIMMRAGLLSIEDWIAGITEAVHTLVNTPARRFRSAVEISQNAAFSDGAKSMDPTNSSYTNVSYYTYGAALALALDLSLRARTDGEVTLDHYMRAMWRVHGRPAAAQPGIVARPYTLKDARDRLAEVSDRAFADEFFNQYIEGREAPDFARLLSRAALVVRKQNPGSAWIGFGAECHRGATVSCLVPWDSPAFEAGLEEGDVLIAFGGRPFTTLFEALRGRKPGDTVTIQFRRRTGAIETRSVTLREDPALEVVPLESTGGRVLAEQKAFRDRWLASKRN